MISRRQLLLLPLVRFLPPNELTIIISGQSNGVSPSPRMPVVSSTRRVYLTHSFGKESFEHRAPTRFHPALYSAAWVYLGDMLVRATGRDVHIVNTSHGNTSSINYLELYGAELTHAIGRYKPDVVLWIQGESDSYLSERDSEMALLSLVKLSKALHDCHWFTALDSYARPAQQQLVDDGVIYRGVDLDLLRDKHPDWFERGGQAEFLPEHLRDHATAWWTVLQTCGLIEKWKEKG